MSFYFVKESFGARESVFVPAVIARSIFVWLKGKTFLFTGGTVIYFVWSVLPRFYYVPYHFS